jgi:hypothetical protein
MKNLCIYKNATKIVVLLSLLVFSNESKSIDPVSLGLTGASLAMGGYKAYESSSKSIDELSKTNLASFVKNYVCNPKKSPEKYKFICASLSGIGSAYAASLLLDGCHKFIKWGTRKFKKALRKRDEQKFTGPDASLAAQEMVAYFAKGARGWKSGRALIEKAQIDELTVGQMLDYQKNVSLPRMHKLPDDDNGLLSRHRKYILELRKDLITYLGKLDKEEKLDAAIRECFELGEKQRLEKKIEQGRPNFSMMYVALMSDKYDLMFTLACKKSGIQIADKQDAMLFGAILLLLGALLSI